MWSEVIVTSHAADRRHDFSNVSIIIPAHNEEHYLGGLLASISRCLPGFVDVVVVNSGFTVDTTKLCPSQPCRVVQLPRRVNPAAARNIGVQHSRGLVLAFLDADVVITDAWAQELGRLLPILASAAHQIVGDRYHVSREPGWLERAWFEPMRQRQPTYINGGNLVTTRTAFVAIGGFPEDFETGEDVELCSRARRVGVTVRVDEALFVHHEGFPKDATAFLKRERWHGAGDYVSVRTAIRSTVVWGAATFLVLHAIAFVALIGAWAKYDRLSTVFEAVALIPLFCLAACILKFGLGKPLVALRAVPVMYLFLVGRSGAMLSALSKAILGLNRNSARSHR